MPEMLRSLTTTCDAMPQKRLREDEATQKKEMMGYLVFAAYYNDGAGESQSPVFMMSQVNHRPHRVIMGSRRFGCGPRRCAIIPLTKGYDYAYCDVSSLAAPVAVADTVSLLSAPVAVAVAETAGAYSKTAPVAEIAKVSYAHPHTCSKTAPVAVAETARACSKTAPVAVAVAVAETTPACSQTAPVAVTVVETARVCLQMAPLAVTVAETARVCSQSPPPAPVSETTRAS